MRFEEFWKRVGYYRFIAELVKNLILLPLLLLAGCGNPKPETLEKQEKPAGLVDLANGGTVSGRVFLAGKPPTMPVLDMSANPACERLNKKPRRAEQVIVNRGGMLKNTFVWIKSGLPEARWAPPKEAAQLEQQGCVYEPHVLGLMVGQQLDISNSDTVNHNVHAESVVNPAFSETEPPRAEKKTKQFDSPEVLIPVSCGVHPWMRSYLGVSPHPFFFVTGDDGTFTLKGVPPGTYTVEAVHEHYGKMEMKVTVGARETKDLAFRYLAGASQ